MKLKELTLAELETMPYDEIAYLILLESGKKEKLLNLYKKVCNLLKLDFEKEQDNVADFFEILTTNKKFVMLDKGYWDLQVNHKANIALDDILEEVTDEEEFEEETLGELEAEEDEDIFYDGDVADDTADDDLASLGVMSDEEDEANL